jgi:hypothetical protein
MYSALSSCELYTLRIHNLINIQRELRFFTRVLSGTKTNEQVFKKSYDIFNTENKHVFFILHRETRAYCNRGEDQTQYKTQNAVPLERLSNLNFSARQLVKHTVLTGCCCFNGNATLSTPTYSKFLGGGGGGGGRGGDG